MSQLPGTVNKCICKGPKYSLLTLSNLEAPSQTKICRFRQVLSRDLKVRVIYVMNGSKEQKRSAFRSRDINLSLWLLISYFWNFYHYRKKCSHKLNFTTLSFGFSSVNSFITLNFPSHFEIFFIRVTSFEIYHRPTSNLFCSHWIHTRFSDL